MSGRQIEWASQSDDEAVCDRLRTTLAKPGTPLIAIPGGGTPRPILQALTVDWDGRWRPTITLTDDRLVPANHPASNFGMVSAALAGTTAVIQPLVEGREAGGFDLVWVGMGADGHVASLFPGSPISRGAPAMVARAWPDPLPPEAPFERLTLTLSALTATQALMIVARGETKRALLEAAVDGDETLPIGQMIAAARSPVTIYWAP
jgi:6-phosphogluconolactonase